MIIYVSQIVIVTHSAVECGVCWLVGRCRVGDGGVGGWRSDRGVVVTLSGPGRAGLGGAVLTEEFERIQ